MLRSFTIATLSLCVAVCSWLYFRANEQSLVQRGQQLWQSRVSLQHAEQSLHKLNAGYSHPLLKVLGEDVTDLQIRLSETFAHWKTNGIRRITGYEQSMLPRSVVLNDVDAVVGGKVENIRILRLDIQANLKHAPEFLDFIQALSRATGGWPTEVRACDVHRMPSQTLDARCVVDVYFWNTESNSSETDP